MEIVYCPFPTFESRAYLYISRQTTEVTTTSTTSLHSRPQNYEKFADESEYNSTQAVL